jgi:hypothetical protein
MILGTNMRVRDSVMPAIVGYQAMKGEKETRGGIGDHPVLPR